MWSIVWDLTYEGATDQQPCPRRNPAHEVFGVYTYHHAAVIYNVNDVVYITLHVKVSL